MRKHRITDADAAKLVSGHTPQGRPELELLAQSLSTFRAASFETAPRPSAALAARLDVGKPSMVSESNKSAFAVDEIETTSPTTSHGNRSRKGLVRTVFTWIAGLGLGLKIALGVAVTAAAATGAGAAGVLPFGTQQTFDEVVSVVIPAEPEEEEEGTDDGVTGEEDVTEGYDPAEGNFGSWVSDLAKDKPGTGQEFGQMVSDEAKDKPHGATDESEVEEGDDDESDDATNKGTGPQSDHGPAAGKGAR